MRQVAYSGSLNFFPGMKTPHLQFLKTEIGQWGNCQENISKEKRLFGALVGISSCRGKQEQSYGPESPVNISFRNTFNMETLGDLNILVLTKARATARLKFAGLAD